MEKVFCKECQHLYYEQQIRFGHSSMKCFEVIQDTFYTRDYGNPKKINENNDCKHFKQKKKSKRKPWHYWLANPWI